ITPEKLKLQQLAKAKAWEDEQKRKLRVAPAIAVGCFFENSPSQTMTGDVRLLYEYKAVMLVAVPVQTSLFGCPEPDKSEEVDSEGVATTSSQKGFQKKSVPDEAMPDLIRLVHGNISGIKRLIREFRVYWLRKTNPPTSLHDESLCEKDKADDSFSEKNGDVSILNESLADCSNIAEADELLGDNGSNNCEEQKKREEGYGCSISKRQLELKITSMACREKRPGFNKICWYVHEKILTQFNMSDIKLPNSWVHILPMPARVQVLNKTAESPGNISESNTPKANKSAKLAKNKASKSSGNIEVAAEVKDDSALEGKETLLKKINKDQRSIKDFACSKDEIVKKSENQTPVASSGSPVMHSDNVSESQTPRIVKNTKGSIINMMSKSGDTIDLTAEVKDDVEEGKETPLKRINKDQRSIKDFACSKDEVVKTSENQTPIANTELPVMTSGSLQLTSNKRKKPNAQKSIVEFTNKSGNKQSFSKKCQRNVKNNTASEPELIYIDIDCEQVAADSCSDLSKTVSCSEITAPVISEACTSSIVEASHAASGVEMPVQTVSNAGSNEESMEVNEAVESTQEESTICKASQC
ncbi:unnamed protein product, partial [Candidula unifasciata]